MNKYIIKVEEKFEILAVSKAKEDMSLVKTKKKNLLKMASDTGK
jgi:hypothetical protein